MIGEAAILSGLWAAQQDDYPVTVQTGHSISELIFSPREILFTGVTRPDALVLVTEDGRRMAGRYLRGADAGELAVRHAGVCRAGDAGPQGGLRLRRGGDQGEQEEPGAVDGRCGAQTAGAVPDRGVAEAIRRGSRGPITEENLEAPGDEHCGKRQLTIAKRASTTSPGSSPARRH